MAATFEIKRSGDGQFYFTLKAESGEVILTSQRYVGKSGVARGIAAVRRSAADSWRFARRQSMTRERYYVLIAESLQPIGASERYSSKAARDRGILAVQRCAAQAAIVDSTV